MTIGIECHVQLATAHLFSPADNDARGKEPTVEKTDRSWSARHVACTQPPGGELGLIRQAGTGCQSGKMSAFLTVKHCFYPGPANGYQITDVPPDSFLLGWEAIRSKTAGTVKVRIHHAHIEDGCW